VDFVVTVLEFWNLVTYTAYGIHVISIG